MLRTLVAMVPWDTVARRAGLLVCGAGLLVLLLGGAPLRGQGRGATSQARPRAAAAAEVVPAADPAADPATPWLATTDPRVRLLFSFHRQEIDCSLGCERYTMWLRYDEPSNGRPPSATWQVASQTTCVDYWVDGRPDIACATFGQLAGRNRHGMDYVLLPMHASRVQIDRMLRARKLVMFQFGTQAFHLKTEGHAALARFLAEAGGI